jgi:hypothetical protein
MESRFDELARLLAQPQPRRRTLRVIFRGAAGAAIVAFLPTKAFAWDTVKCGTATCPDGQICCNATTSTCCPSSQCLKDLKGAGVCCPTGTKACGGTCCGAVEKCCFCGTTSICCLSTQSCGASNGVAVCVDINPPTPGVTCTPLCEAGFTCCAGPAGVGVCCPFGCDSTTASRCAEFG